MTVRVQIELSDEEDKIVEVYRIEHDKKSSEEAIKEIIKNYTPLKGGKEGEEYKEKNKKSWWKRF
jgi:hypothetical protein